jgi:hypothetical protein
MSTTLAAKLQGSTFVVLDLFRFIYQHESSKNPARSLHRWRCIQVGRDSFFLGAEIKVTITAPPTSSPTFSSF